MFKKCKHCHSVFKGEGYFCSDMCEIKNHASEVMTYKKDTITTGTKEEFNQVKEELPETPIITNEIVEIKEKLIQIETDLEISKKTDKSRNDQVF